MAELSRPGVLVGVGCTAALASGRPKRGDHRCHIATYTNEGASLYSLCLRKESRSRVEEDEVVSAVWVAALAATCGLQVNPDLLAAAGITSAGPANDVVELSAMEPDVLYGPRITAHGRPLDQLLAQQTPTVFYTGSSGLIDADGAGSIGGASGSTEVGHGLANVPLRSSLVFPGSFNPIHRGAFPYEWGNDAHSHICCNREAEQIYIWRAICIWQIYIGRGGECKARERETGIENSIRTPSDTCGA
jgi:hypothetical protein